MFLLLMFVPRKEFLARKGGAGMTTHRDRKQRGPLSRQEGFTMSHLMADVQQLEEIGPDRTGWS